MDLLHLVKDLIVSVPCVPKRQERDLDKLKEYLTIRRSVKWAQNNYHHIEILLSSYGEENKNPEGLLWGEQIEEPIPVYTLGQGPNSKKNPSSTRCSRRQKERPITEIDILGHFME